MPCSRITRATRLWLTRSVGGTPSLSSAVIRGAPSVLSASWTARIRSASSASAAAAGRPGRAPRQPGVERGTRDLDELAQPLHLEGVPVVGDELEAAHQFVSPAKYLAAGRRMSRSVASLVVSASSSRDPGLEPGDLLLGRLVRRARAQPGVGCPGLSGLRVNVPSAAVFLPVPYRLEPVPQRATLDPQVLGDATHRRTRSGLVQVDGLPTELIGVVLAGHGSGSSRSPPQCWIQRVQNRVRPQITRIRPLPLSTGRIRARRARRVGSLPILWARSDGGMMGDTCPLQRLEPIDESTLLLVVLLHMNTHKNPIAVRLVVDAAQVLAPSDASRELETSRQPRRPSRSFTNVLAAVDLDQRAHHRSRRVEVCQDLDPVEHELQPGERDLDEPLGAGQGTATRRRCTVVFPVPVNSSLRAETRDLPHSPGARGCGRPSAIPSCSKPTHLLLE